MADKLKQFKGTILANGYGLLSKFTMRDSKLNVGAKALYSYLTTWGNECFPGRDLICHDLKINEKTFAIYLAALKTRGYVTVEQIKEKGRFYHNVYTIEHDLNRIIEIHKELEAKENRESLSCAEKRNAVRKKSHHVPENGIPNFGTPKNGAVITQPSSNTSYKNKTTNKDTVVAFSPSALVTDSERELVAKLLDIGIKEKIACKFISQYGLDSVRAQLENLAKAISEGNKPGKKPVKSPGAWITIALRENFADNRVKYEAVINEQKIKAHEINRNLEAQVQCQLIADSENIELDIQSLFTKIVRDLGIKL